MKFVFFAALESKATMIVPFVLSVLIGFLLVACVTDVKEKAIYNWTTYPGILTGIMLRGAEGWAGLQESLAGLLICGGIMLVCFVLFDLGGGDLKLIAMVGAFLGPIKGIEAMLWTFILGAVLAMMILIWRFGAFSILKGVVGHLWLLIRTCRWVPLNPEEREPLQWGLFLGPATLIAVLIVTYESWANVREFHISF